MPKCRVYPENYLNMQLITYMDTLDYCSKNALVQTKYSQNGNGLLWVLSTKLETNTSSVIIVE